VLQDTTVIIDALEKRHPEHSVYPSTPKQKLVSLLLEVYTDEWLCITAMHYRWNFMEEHGDYVYEQFCTLLSPFIPPFFPPVIRRFFGRKLGERFKGFVPMLGITDNNHQALEKSYEALLDDLSAHFKTHDYLLGSKPCIADFGLMGALYAHLYLDPAPAKIMKERAPLVAKWVERMNNQEAYLQQGEWIADDHIPDTLIPILKRMATEQLPVLIDTDKHLAQWRIDNPEKEEIKRFIGRHDFTVEGVKAQRIIIPYSLWMFQRPIDFYQSLETTYNRLKFAS